MSEKTLIEQLTDKLTEKISASVFEAVCSLLVEFVREQKQSIEEKLDRYIGGHYLKALEYLDDAQNVQIDRRAGLIEKALDEFLTASKVTSGRASAEAELSVGICYELLGEQNRAMKYYGKAFETANSFIIENRKSVKGRSLRLGSVISVGGAGAATAAGIGIAAGPIGWAVLVGGGVVSATAGYWLTRKQRNLHFSTEKEVAIPLAALLTARGIPTTITESSRLREFLKG